MFLFYRNLSKLNFLSVISCILSVAGSFWFVVNRQGGVLFRFIWGLLDNLAVIIYFPVQECIPQMLDSFLQSYSPVTVCGSPDLFSHVEIVWYWNFMGQLPFEVIGSGWHLSSSPQQPVMGQIGLPEPLVPCLSEMIITTSARRHRSK